MNTSKRETPLPVESLHSALKITGLGVIFAGALAALYGDYIGNGKVELGAFLGVISIWTGILLKKEFDGLLEVFAIQYGEDTSDPLKEWESI